MRSSKPWLIAFAFMFVLALSASSASATSYVRGYVRPSGDGGPCAPTTTSPLCVSDDGTTLSNGPFGPLVSPDNYQIVGVTSVVLKTEVDFTFAGPVTTSLTPVNPDHAGTAFSSFSVLACAYQNNGTSVSPGIYNTNGDLESTNCTQLGDYSTAGAFTDPSNFINEVTCTTANMVCLTFSGTGLPSTWFFAEDTTTGPRVLSLTETFPASAPEPASLSLLAVGLVGLGMFRRKRGA
jgi:PEP-CTERM motif-containing protein